MDPDFMSRYLPQQGAEREAGQGQGEPVGEPDVGEVPSSAGRCAFAVAVSRDRAARNAVRYAW